MKKLIGGLVVVSVLFLGCEKKSEETPVETPVETPAPAEANTTAPVEANTTVPAAN
jgi:hypothetical protein